MKTMIMNVDAGVDEYCEDVVWRSRDFPWLYIMYVFIIQSSKLIIDKMVFLCNKSRTCALTKIAPV